MRIEQLIRQQRRQLVSTVGLAILFFAPIAALSHGVVSGLGMALACLPPLLFGLAIASLRRWVAMACVAVGGALAALFVGGTGVAGSTLAAGAAMVTLAATVFYLKSRAVWPQFLAVAGAFALLGIWQAGQQLSAAALLLALLTVWAIGSFTALHQRLLARDENALVLAIGVPIASFVLAATAAGFTAHFAALCAVLLSAFGLAFDQVPGRPTRVGEGLLMLGLAIGAVASSLWAGAQGLCFALGGLALLLLFLLSRRPSKQLEAFALLSLLSQALTMLVIHPGLRHAAPFYFHYWAISALAIAAQLGAFVWLWRKQPRLLSARWTQGVFAAQALYVLAALSTEIALSVQWAAALTLLWTAASAALWLLGRRVPGLRATAALSITAAAVKLMAYDWALLGPQTRMTLLMLIGATMLVTPLFSGSGEQRWLMPKSNSLQPRSTDTSSDLPQSSASQKAPS
jgi:hypothetical protein